MSGQPGQQGSGNLLKEGGNSNMGLSAGMAPQRAAGQRWTPNDLTAYGKAQQAQRIGNLQSNLASGGWDKVFAGQQGQAATPEMLGNQFFNAMGTAANYSPEQVQAMSQSMPMQMGDTSKMLYRGQIYDNPAGGGMALLNALNPSQLQGVAQTTANAGAGTWREQDVLNNTNTIPTFQPAAETPAGANTATPAASPAGGAGAMLGGMSPNAGASLGGKGGGGGGVQQFGGSGGYDWNPTMNQQTGATSYGQMPGGRGNRYASYWRY